MSTSLENFHHFPLPTVVDVSRLVRDRIWVERYRAVARLGMHALCTSHAVRQQLLEIDWPTSQINVIHLGVDTEHFGSCRRRSAGRHSRGASS